MDERVGRALVELTRRSEARTADPLALLDQVPTDRLVDRACHHRVPGVVYRSLSELGMDGAEFAGLRAAYQMASLSHGRCLLELGTVAEALGELEHPWLVVKGPVLAEIGYGDPGARLYEDLDIVVAATDLSAALTGIEAAGGRVTDLNWPMMVELMRAEVPMVLPSRDARRSPLAPAGHPVDPVTVRHVHGRALRTEEDRRVWVGPMWPPSTPSTASCTSACTGRSPAATSSCGSRTSTR